MDTIIDIDKVLEKFSSLDLIGKLGNVNDDYSWHVYEFPAKGIVDAMRPMNIISNCITAANRYDVEVSSKTYSSFKHKIWYMGLSIGLSCALSYTIYKAAPYVRAWWNDPKPPINKKDGPLEYSSYCNTHPKTSGFINKKTREMIEAGFNQEVMPDGRKKLTILKNPLGPFPTMNNNKKAVPFIRRRLMCDRELDKAVKTKGPNFGLYPIKYHTCPYNMWIALLRIFNPVPNPDMKIVAEYGKWYQDKWIPEVLKKVDTIKSTPTYDDWISNVKPYVRRYVADLLENGCPQNPSRVGFEIGVKTDELMVASEDDVRPRPIQQARNLDKYTYRGIWFITKILADLDYAYRCGANWEADAKVLGEVYANVNDAIMIPGDLSSNDATQSYPERQSSDLILIRKLLSLLDDTWVDDLGAALANVTGESEQKAQIFEYGDFRAHLLGSQNTGASDTTFGNTERNRRRMQFFLTEKLGLKEVTYDHINKTFGPGDYGILVLGDDFLLVINKKFLQKVQDNMSIIYCKDRYSTGGLGHWFKDALDPNWPEFCSRDLLNRGDGTFRWMRKIKKFIQTTPFTISVSSNSTRVDVIEFELKKLAYMEGIGILKWAKGLPLYHKYAQTFPLR